MNKKLLIALGCASMLICGCNNSVQEPNQNEIQEVVKTEFKATDGKVTFKKVETTQEVIDEFKKDLFDQNFSLDNIQEYAYVNNIVYAISQKEEDDTYAKYSGYFSASVGAQYNIIFLINKTTGEIIEVNKIVDDSYNYNEVSGLIARFSGETNSVDFFKTDAGYFFVRHTMNSDIIYTTSLKKLGMVDDYKKIKADSEGIYVYTEYSEDIEPVESSYTKFNSIGEIIESKASDTKKLYSIVDGNKYSIYSHMNLNGRPEYQNENVTADFSYPIINIENEDIKKLNNTIKESFEQVENNLKSQNSSDGCICIKINNEYRCGGEHLETQEYKVYESSKYLTIQIRKVGRTYCAGGYDDYVFYTISKDTGKILSKNNLLNIIKVEESIFENDIKQKYQEEYSLNFDDFDFVKYGMYDNNTLIVMIPGENINSLYTYDGTKLVVVKNS